MQEVSRRAILFVPFGPLACRKVVLSPGGRVRIGREDESDLALPFDPSVSLSHCEVAWDGEGATLRDLGSASGTFARGERVEETTLGHGEVFRVGATRVVLYLEAATPARFAVTDEERRAADAALSVLAAEPGAACHAVLDAAKSPRVLELLRESVDELHSLYEGTAGQALADVAPYLVRFSPDSWLLRAVLEEGLGEAWGIFVAWAGPTRELRRHLRRFLIVEEEESRRRLYFRFYDPRVLGEFLAVATPRQRDELLGEARSVFYEGASRSLVRAERPSWVREGGAHVARP